MQHVLHSLLPLHTLHTRPVFRSNERFSFRRACCGKKRFSFSLLHFAHVMRLCWASPLAFWLSRFPMEPLAFLLPFLRLCLQMTHCVARGPLIGRPELQTVQRGNWSCSAEAKSPTCNFSMLSGLMLPELAESVQWLDKCLSFRHVNMLPSVYNSLRPAKPARIKFKMNQWKSRAAN